MESRMRAKDYIVKSEDGVQDEDLPSQHVKEVYL